MRCGDANYVGMQVELSVLEGQIACALCGTPYLCSNGQALFKVYTCVLAVAPRLKVESFLLGVSCGGFGFGFGLGFGFGGGGIDGILSFSDEVVWIELQVAASTCGSQTLGHTP